MLQTSSPMSFIFPLSNPSTYPYYLIIRCFTIVLQFWRHYNAYNTASYSPLAATFTDVSNNLRLHRRLVSRPLQCRSDINEIRKLRLKSTLLNPFCFTCCFTRLLHFKRYIRHTNYFSTHNKYLFSLTSVSYQETERQLRI